MQIIKITDNFYRLVDVFSDTTLQKIHNCFQDKSIFSKLWQGEYHRLEAGQFDQTVINTIKTELSPAREFAENTLGEKLYPNNTQLWEDFDGYLT